MDDALTNDLNLSHAFINALSASYQGLFVFVNVMEQLAPSPNGAQALQHAGTSVEAVNKLWAGWKEQRPLVQLARRDDPSPDLRNAWEMLAIAKKRLRSFIQDLSRSSDLDRLMDAPAALNLRVACSCEAAYARHHFIQGLILYGEVMKKEEVADRWRQHTPHCHAEINESHGDLEALRRMNGHLEPDAVASILDNTLGLPAFYGQRVNDINTLFAQYRGRLEYVDMEIPEAETKEWADRGILPHDAGRWFQAGFTPDETMLWVRGGVPDPVAAFNYLLRGFEPEEAAPWLQAGFSALQAARWAEAGMTPAQASEKRRQGIQAPSRQPG